MPIPLQEMIPGESGDRGMVNCHSPGKGEFSAYSSGFGSGNRGNKNTKYRHSFESLVHNHHYTLEILGFHYMQLSKFEVKCTKFLFYKNNFYNSGSWMFYERLYCIIFNKKKKKCQESCFSGTSGNSDGDGEANSIPRGMGS